MMNLNLGSCDLLLMFIVLVVALVFKLKALIISLLFYFYLKSFFLKESTAWRSTQVAEGAPLERE